MDISPAFFYTFAVLGIASAVMVVLQRNPIASAFSLVLVFFSFGAIYALLGAHLIAAMQILVYTGAVMVLFVFVIMLLNAEKAVRFDLKRGHPALQAVAAALALALVGFFVSVFKASPVSSARGPYTLEAIAASGGNTRVISRLMFSEYILPFELTSFLLLAAIVGVVAIAMRKKTGGMPR